MYMYIYTYCMYVYIIDYIFLISETTGWFWKRMTFCWRADFWARLSRNHLEKGVLNTSRAGVKVKVACQAEVCQLPGE